MKWIWNLIKQLSKKKIFWIIFAIIIVIVVVLVLRGGKKIIYITEKVQRGNLTQTVSETGTIESASAIDLNFKGSGRLAEINVKEGDTVKAGDLLARLDAGSLEIAVQQSRANLSAAQANLNKLLAGASSEDLQVSQQSVNNAKIALDNAQNSYNDAQTQSTKAISDSRQALYNEVFSQIEVARKAIDSIKGIFDNYDLKFTFSVKNDQYGINAHNYYDEALVRMSVAETSVSNLQANDTEENLNDAEAKLSDALSWIKNALDNTYLGLINTLVGDNYNETIYEADKANITNEQNLVNAGISGLDLDSQTYANAKINQTTTLNNAKAALDSAQGAYNLAQAQYNLKAARPRNVDIASYQAQVAQAQAALNLALNNLSDYIIYAPADGTITFVNFKVGEQVSISGGVSGAMIKPVISMLSTSDFQIKIDVPESDIVKVQLGNKANLTLDAYGSDTVFTGKVVKIDVAETVIQDVVYYQVTVQLDPTDKLIKSGMTANVNILTAEDNNVLFVSNRAVKETADGQKYVEVKSGNGTRKINVTTGLKGDEGKIEITSGLSEGQEVIVYTQQ